ncbi:MAG: Fic family protein [Patescibacteria group bacterium]|nr:Fic family protein [Patescibacteria group bacterium]
MNKKTIKNPFSQDFLKKFALVPELLPFKDEEVVKLDKELSEYEHLFMNPEVERNLISKNELLASFAISKAEESSLTLKEAQDVYNFVLQNNEYDFIRKKIKNKKKLTQKDYEKLEFFNIAKTFRKLNQEPFKIEKLSPNFIKNIHSQLTQGLDVFHKYLPSFTVYKSGKWRDNDTIRVWGYKPPSYEKIPAGVKELIAWIKDNNSINGVAIFHTALYALHPFHNGNKRVCRILEHILFRGLGLNSKNLYSTSYYYHKQKDRYYKYLLYSIERKNLNHFTSFVLEAVVLSIISVLKTSLEIKRSEFLEKKIEDARIKLVLKPLIRRRELQFKTLFKISKKKIARQTFVSYLQRAVENKTLKKRKAGRAVYYRLNLQTPEDKVFKKWIDFTQQRLSYLPYDIKLS